MTAIETLICGCPLAEVADGFQHRSGCWMGEVEGVARGAVLRVERMGAGSKLLNALINLSAHGHLRDITHDDELLGVLDYLADAGLLAAVEGGGDDDR